MKFEMVFNNLQAGFHYINIYIYRIRKKKRGKRKIRFSKNMRKKIGRVENGVWIKMVGVYT